MIAALEGYRVELAGRRHPLLGAPSSTIGTIDGGTVAHMVASECRMALDRRILPGEDVPAALAEVLGAPPAIGGKDGGTDAAWIYRQAGIPMVQFGSGDSRFVPARDERAEIAAHIAAIEALVLTFEEILGVAS